MRSWYVVFDVLPPQRANSWQVRMGFLRIQPACRVNGYVGEVGFEVSLSPCIHPYPCAQNLFHADLYSTIASRGTCTAPQDVHTATSLGARDNLLLEAAMCVYGNGLTEDTMLIEAAGLS